MTDGKLKIPFPIVVEGKYDRAKLLCVADARVITTEGFGIFNKSEKLALLRALSGKTRIIVLSDSDGAGKMIRSHITSAIPKDKLIQVYIPRVEGKEKRKTEPSKEGVLGVEGMETDLLKRLLEPYADGTAIQREAENPLGKSDFYAAGLSGKPDSAIRRDAFAAKLGLPPKMTANALLSAARLLITYEEYNELIKEL